MRRSGALAAQLVILLATGGIAAHAQTAPANSPSGNPPAVAAPNNGNPTSSGETGGAPPSAPSQEPSSEAPIHLHMPTAPVAQEHEPAPPVVRHKKHVVAVRAAKPPAPDLTPESATPAPATSKATQKPAPAITNDEATGSGELANTNTVPFSFVPESASKPSGQFFQPPPSAHAPRVAKASPPPAQSLPSDTELTRGLVRQSQILFAPGAPDPSADAMDAIRSLAGPLNTALAAGAARIQVIAYGGNRGDRSSDARRLSLKRALAIRQLLIEGGVPARVIDVRAMGGATDGAAADRVDVFTKA